MSFPSNARAVAAHTFSINNIVQQHHLRDEAMKPIIIQKYGGSSVATLEKLESIAKSVVKRHADGYGIVVVVSAMGNSTDELLRQASKITPQPPARELDMLLSTGERTTMALLSIAIQKYGAEAISFTGSQSGIITNDSHAHARIIAVRPYRIQDELEKGKIVIVAGFQGTSYRNEITTLGRGGSDMTAVALAGALNAESCEIYSDVDGVYTADPKVVLDAQKLDELSSADIMAMAQHGAKVLHDEAVAYARRHQIALHAKKSHDPEKTGTYIRPDGWPDFALKAAELRPTAVVSAKRVLWLDLCGISLSTFLERVSQADGARIFDLQHAGDRISALLDVWNCRDLDAIRQSFLSGCTPNSRCELDVSNVTLVGEDIGRDLQIVTRAGELLRDAAITPKALFCQANAITYIVSQTDAQEASRALHTMIDPA